MKKIILSLTLMLSASLLWGGDVKVKINNLKDKEAVVRVSDMKDGLLLDTVITINNGKMSYKNRFSEPVKLIIVPKSGMFDTKTVRKVVVRQTMQIELYLMPNEDCQLEGECNGLILTYKVKNGSQTNTVLADMRSEYIKMHRYYDMESEYFSQNKTKEQRDSVYNIGKSVNEQYNAKAEAFAMSNPDKQLSGLFIEEFSYDTAKKLYSKLTNDVKDGQFKNTIAKMKKRWELVDRRKVNDIGATAIDFSLVGLDGNTISLSKLKGKYVFIYFWGSWCHWCTAGAPNLNKFYNDYKDKVEFIGIACNDKEPALKSCIEKYDIKWKNYLELIDNRISTKYGVTGYPTKVLVGPDGKIVFRYDGEHEEFYKKVVEYIK